MENQSNNTRNRVNPLVKKSPSNHGMTSNIYDPSQKW